MSDYIDDLKAGVEEANLFLEEFVDDVRYPSDGVLLKILDLLVVVCYARGIEPKKIENIVKCALTDLQTEDKENPER